MCEKKRVVILGGGVSGLSAGYYLAKSGRFHVTVLEQSPVTGGLCASFEHKGFVLDHGGHKLYTIIPGIMDELASLMEGRLLRIKKRNRIYFRGHLLDYPFRIGNLIRSLGISTILKIGFEYGLSILRRLSFSRPVHTYEEYMVSKFGRHAYRLLLEPMADKVWGRPSELHAALARMRVPTANATDVILKLFGLKKETPETNAEFFYYPRGGFGVLPETLQGKMEALGGRVLVDSEVHDIEVMNGMIQQVQVLVDGKQQTFPCDYLISSIPFGVLGRLVFGDSSPEFNRTVEGLVFRHIILVYIFIRRSLVLQDHWIVFPEKQFIFSRVVEQKQMNPELGPPDQTALCCDFTCLEQSAEWQADDKTLAAQCIEGLVQGGFIQAEEVAGYLVKRSRNFYPRYDTGYRDKLGVVLETLGRFNNLLLTGRIGMFNYNDGDHCLDMGRFIARGLEKNMEPARIMAELELRVGEYKIVD